MKVNDTRAVSAEPEPDDPERMITFCPCCGYDGLYEEPLRVWEAQTAALSSAVHPHPNICPRSSARTWR